MRFFASASALLAMTSAAVAQTADFNPIYTPGNLEEVPAGSSFEVTWTAPAKYADGTVSIHLIGGADQNSLVPLADLATGVANADEAYAWPVDASLGTDALYGLVIKYENDPAIFQYSMPFHIKAGSGGDDSSEDGEGEGGVIVTTHTGIKTVTLSSCPPTSTSTTEVEVTTSSALNTTSIVKPTTTSAWVTTTAYNTTTSAWSTPSTIIIETPTVTGPPIATTEIPPPVGTPTEVPVGSAARFGSGALAVAGGLAVALFL